VDGYSQVSIIYSQNLNSKTVISNTRVRAVQNEKARIRSARQAMFVFSLTSVQLTIGPQKPPEVSTGVLAICTIDGQYMQEEGGMSIR
jgi:hypothetical protein